jgi:hypothetical protein
MRWSSLTHERVTCVTGGASGSKLNQQGIYGDEKEGQKLYEQARDDLNSMLELNS